MSSNIYGIDFGTCNFKVFCKASGKILSEKNTIAIVNKNKIYAYLEKSVDLNVPRQERQRFERHQ